MSDPSVTLLPIKRQTVLAGFIMFSSTDALTTCPAPPTRSIDGTSQTSVQGLPCSRCSEREPRPSPLHVPPRAECRPRSPPGALDTPTPIIPTQVLSLGDSVGLPRPLNGNVFSRQMAQLSPSGSAPAKVRPSQVANAQRAVTLCWCMEARTSLLSWGQL